MRIHRTILQYFIAIFIPLLSINTYAQSNTIQINWNSFMQEQQLRWDSISTNYYTGILLGNGRLGTNIYKESDKAIRFDIGRSDVTDQRPHYPDSVNSEQLLSKPRLPIGKMLLHTKGNIVNATMQLDIYNAESTGTITTTLGSIHFYAIVPTGEEVIVVKIFGTGEEKKTLWEFIAEESISPRITAQSKKQAAFDYTNNPPFIEKDSAQFHYCYQPLLFSDGYATAYQLIKKADTSTLVLAVGNAIDFKTSAKKEAFNYINSYFAKKEKTIIQTHRKWWHEYSEKSMISVPDARMQNYYTMEQYNMAAATRAGKPMVDLMGPWFKSKTPWPAIWWNLNTQLAYSSVFTSNHLEIGRSLFDALYNNRNTLIKNAPKQWQNDAAAIARISSYDLYSPVTQDEIDNGKFEPGNLTWTLFYYHKYFLYSKDSIELKNRIFPLLKRSVNFLLHLLSNDEKGIYHLANSFSPEYSDAIDAHYSLSALKWGLTTLIATNKNLSLNDPDRKKWEEVLLHLTPYYSTEIGYLIGKDKPLLNGHRHFSHLMMIYPYREVSFTDTTAASIMNKSINYWESLSKKFRGYSYVAASSMSSLNNNGNKAYQYLDTFLNRHAEVNGLYAEAGPCFETPHAMTNSLLEMLLQSQEPLIRVFPAIPDNWKDVSFVNLRAEGAFLVSALRKNAHTTIVIVTSEKGGKASIETDIAAANIIVQSNKSKANYKILTQNNKSTINISTSAGEIITIRDRTNATDIISPIKQTSFSNQYWGLQVNHKESVIKLNRK